MKQKCVNALGWWWQKQQVPFYYYLYEKVCDGKVVTRFLCEDVCGSRACMCTHTHMHVNTQSSTYCQSCLQPLGVKKVAHPYCLGLE